MKSLLFLVFAVSCLSAGFVRAAEDSLKKEVVSTYARIVHASYEDSLATARQLRDAIGKFVAEPSPLTFDKAKQSWIGARKPYLQTEVYRFYAGPIDDEDGPEGLLNAWPLDEAYVDYVEGNENAGIVNHPDEYPDITPELLTELNEKDGEENISAGYHAIEFLLWGQDLSADGPGNRPITDFTSAPQGGRRCEYLVAASELIVQNLGDLVAAWEPGREDNYRAAFEGADPDDSLQKILTGISMLSGFELSGERILVALETRAQEDEHSCFSDTTHLDIAWNALGIVNVWNGSYRRVNDEVVKGTGLKDLAASVNPALSEKLGSAIERSHSLSESIPPPFDRVLMEESDEAPGRKAAFATLESLEDQADLVVALSRELGFDVPITEQ